MATTVKYTFILKTYRHKLTQINIFKKALKYVYAAKVFSCRWQTVPWTHYALGEKIFAYVQATIFNMNFIFVTTCILFVDSVCKRKKVTCHVINNTENNFISEQ